MDPSGGISDYNTTKDVPSDDEKGENFLATPMEKVDVLGEMSERERTIHEDGMHKFHRLGWKRLALVLLVEAIALGCLSLPQAFATLGMVAGVICCIGLGVIAVYTSYIIGQVKLKFPHISHYGEAGRLMFGRFGYGGLGYELFNVMLILQLLFIVSSHLLGGTIALVSIIDRDDICSIALAVVSAVILFALAVPPSFTEVAILGYVDFVSICAAILITMIGTGIQSSNSIGLANVNWSAWPKEGINFRDAFIAMSNIIFAYTFAMCQFSFMDEMHTPSDFPKSVKLMGSVQVSIYTLTGAIIYAFVGQDVQSPALLSAGKTLSRVAFGVALPVIYISGSINSVVMGRLIHGRIYKNSPIRFVNTKMGWITWLATIASLSALAFVISEIIPFFDDLLSICSALFVSGFTFYIPAVMWFMLVREGPWNSPKNLALGVINAIILLVGLITLAGGTYSSIADIVSSFSFVLFQGCQPLFRLCQLLIHTRLFNRSKTTKRAKLEGFSLVRNHLECTPCLAGQSLLTIR